MTSIVVTARWGGDPPPASELAREVRAAVERVAAFGARLVGVGADGASFGLDDGALEDAIELALALVHERAGRGARFRVGIAAGDLAPIRDEDPFERLSVGSAAARATALARTAQPGEILVDAAIAEAASGALLSIGRRVATLEEGGESIAGAAKRLRAIILDPHEPWRRAGESAVRRLHEPRLVGREGSLAILEAVDPGGLALLRAPAGIGGTRLLEELSLRTAATLLIEPSACGVEPLGALRLSLHRARLARPRELAPRTAELFDELSSGQGLDLASASDLICAWLARSPGGIEERAWVLIDDANHVDRATLEAVGHAASVPDAPFAVVARIDPVEVVPQALAGLVVEADLHLKPLQPHEARVVVEEACGGAAHLGGDLARRWARRGGGVPLALVEALRHGLVSSELAVRTIAGVDTFVARTRASGRGRTLAAQGWIVRRLSILHADRPDDALLASIVAVAGGGLPRRIAEETAVDLGLQGGRAFEGSIERLSADAILQARGELLGPTSRTMREAILERIEQGERRTIHAALAGAIARSATGLALAEGAHHAALAGDHLGAASLATRAGDRARRAGLEDFARGLLAFARAEGAPQALPTTPSPPPQATVRSPAPPSRARPPRDLALSLGPDDLVSEPPEDPRSVTVRTPPPSNPPPRAAKSLLPAASIPPLDPSDEPTIHYVPQPNVEPLSTRQIAALPAPPSTARNPLPSSVPEETEEIGFDSSAPFEPPPAFEPALGDTEPEPETLPRGPREQRSAPAPSGAPAEALGQLAGAAREALARRDLPALEAALSAIEVAFGSSAAVARLRGIAAIAGGRLVEGVQLTRAAVDRSETAAARARSELAFAVALARAGDRDGAVAEALAALASERRRAHGGAGDHACVRVLERLLAAPGS